MVATSRLDIVIRGLEQAGHAADAKAVRVAQKLAERALANDPGAEPPMLLTTRQAGRALGVSIQTIRNWVHAVRFRAEQHGPRTMIPREAVLEEIERLHLGEAPDIGAASRSRRKLALPEALPGA